MIRPPNKLQVAMVACFAADVPLVAIRAGWGSGKTSGEVFVAMACAEARPGCKMLWVTDTGRRLTGVVQVECQKFLAADGWTWHKSDGYWEHPNGAWLWLRSFFKPGTRDINQSNLEGGNVTLFMGDECQTMSSQLLDVAVGRVRTQGEGGEDYPPVMMFAGLPVHGAWWIQAARKWKGGKCLFASTRVNQANLASGYIENIANLPESRRRAMVDNDPQPLTGAVYRNWSGANILPDSEWRYDPSWIGHFSADWGLNKPAGLVIVRDPVRRADVIVADICPRNPDGVSEGMFVAAVLRAAWPRAHHRLAPGGRSGYHGYWLDDGTGDKAGRKKNEQTLLTTFQLVAKPPNPQSPTSGGLGMVLYNETKPHMVNVPNGVQKVHRVIYDEQTGHRGLLILESVWNEGLAREGNSFARAIGCYSYPDGGGEEPDKDGREDPLDAYRYHAIRHHWWYDPMDDRRPTYARPSTTPTSPVADYLGDR